jgi:hypothetical protein
MLIPPKSSSDENTFSSASGNLEDLGLKKLCIKDRQPIYKLNLP